MASEHAMDRKAALVRVGGDAELLEELLALMLDESRRLLRTIREGLARGDARAVHVAAHTLKGSAANLEAAALTDVAARLERLARNGDLATGEATCEQLAAELLRLEGEASP